MKDKYFKLFANCIPIKGYKRSLICDLQNSIIKYIPNALYNILTEKNQDSINSITSHYGAENKEVIKEYFNFLVENYLGFYCKKEELNLFPKIDLNFYDSSHISNCIIDIKNKNHNYKMLAKEFNNLLVKHIQVRIFKKLSDKLIDNIMHAFNDSGYLTIEFYAKNNENIPTNYFENIFTKHPRLKKVFLFSSAKEHSINFYDKSQSLFYLKDTLNENCGYISPEYFCINKNCFTESIVYNNCLNKKIGIDKNGNIKNCPSQKETFGNIKTDSITTVVNSEKFKNLWLITKDNIQVCCDCEYRYICTDCRIYRVNDSILSKPLRCSYDPYTATWK